jgi:medium-chain acyl-[acyl-carrier-protein] hydrolase
VKATKIFEDIVICPKPNPQARLRLFCFPFAGGGPTSFHSWLEALPPDVGLATEICSIQLPGRCAVPTEPLVTRLTPLVEALIPAFRYQSEMQFAFFGHSMGALISFELARELRRRGMTGPIHLIVSGHRAPDLPDPHASIHELPDNEFIARLRELDGTPEQVLQDPELMAIFLPVLRADFAVCETYHYEPDRPLDCSITVFGGNHDRRVQRDELSAWRSQTSKFFAVRMFPGGHFFLQTSFLPFVFALTHDLRQLLRRISLS